VEALSTSFRWQIYALLLVVTAGLLLARVASVRSPDPRSPTPFQSANDRSRWATIRALADDGTYAIDHIIFDQRGSRVRGWHTIDLVRHVGPDGREHYYSSKPTLLPTLLAGPYWLFKMATGATLAEHPHYVARWMLALVNVLPLLVALWLLARLIDGLATTDFARIFAVGAACFGTFLTTFAVTLNNHLTAAIPLVVGLAVIVPMWRTQRFGWGGMATAGLCLAFVAANELPALSILALTGMGLALRAPRTTLLAFVPAALVVAAGAIGTNILAHGDWRTPYAHRHDGPVLATVGGDLAAELDAGRVPSQLAQAAAAAGVSISDEATIDERRPGGRWSLWDPASNRRLALVQSGEPPQATIEIRRWDNWYDYPGSYWRPENLRGIDRGEASPWVYARNVLIGHHGLFSLTPIWLLSAAGCWLWLWPRSGERLSPASDDERPDAAWLDVRFVLAATTLIITVVVLAFYLSRPQIDRNYGGGTSCLRWLLWLAPLWLLTLLPAADRLSRRGWGRALLLALLGVSVFSAHYAAANPWSHPWLFDYWTWLGWIEY
jgi:hypothetical protein